MRIAEIYHDFSQRGGAERHVETLSQSLGELGHEVTIVSATPPEGFRGWRAEFSRLKAPLSALRLARWMRRERIQLVHAHSRISAAIASFALRFHRVPLVVTSHILPAGFHKTSQWGDATICVSEVVRRRLIECYGVPGEQLNVIHNGIDSQDLTTPPLNFGPLPVFSLVARFVAGKGHQMFLETASRMLANGFAGTFVLAGDGPLEPSLRQRYASSRIVFLGHRNDVAAIFSSSTASVVCSEAEAFSYVALESLAVGTPVISTDCGGPAELIRAEGRNGFLFPVGDTGSLRHLMEELSHAHTGLASRRQIAEQCRATFSRAQMVEATLAVYRHVCPEVYPL